MCGVLLLCDASVTRTRREVCGLGTLAPQCLLPGVDWRHLFQLRFRWDIDENGFIAGHRFGNGRNKLIWIGDAYPPYAKCPGNAGGVHWAGEIDAEVAVAVVQALQHLDPSKAAVIEQDDGDGQVQASNGREFRTGHTERAIAHQPNDAFTRSGEGCAHRCGQRIAQASVSTRNDDGTPG